jgi:hypothetical protein
MSNPQDPSRQTALSWRTLERWGMPRSVGASCPIIILPARCITVPVRMALRALLKESHAEQ